VERTETLWRLAMVYNRHKLGHGLGVDRYDPNLQLYLPLWHKNCQPSTFYSLDNNRQLFTATGTTQVKKGRVFDGDDYLKYTVADWRGTDSLGSVSVWFNTSNTGATKFIFASGDEAAGSKYIGFYIRTSNLLAIHQTDSITPSSVQGSTVVTDGRMHFVTFVSTDTEWIIHLDGGTESLTVLDGTNNGKWFSDTANRDNVSIGVEILDTRIGYFIGTIGDVLYHSKALSLAEHIKLMERTKWRYR
jgi:hypothetical protein